MKVVGSLTTIPGRYPKLLRTLQSLNKQDYPLDAIYLGIPKESRRLKQPYPDLPEEILQLCTVVECDADYGPLTKIVGGILAEDDPETCIITFDDDVVYSHNMVSEMVKLHKEHPDVAIGSSGVILTYDFPFYSSHSNGAGGWNGFSFDLDEHGRDVDALCGFSAVLYLRKFFPGKDELYDKFLKYPLMDDDVFFNDDIMISAYLSKDNIPRKVFHDLPTVNEEKALYGEVGGLDGNEISYDKLAFLQRFRRSINKTQEWGFFAQTQQVSIDETIGGRVIVLGILLLLIIIISIFLYQYLI